MSYNYETAAPDRYDILKGFAKDNRREMTQSETILWEVLRKEFKGLRFRRQHAIGDYIADFVCISKKLVIEVDGEYHDEATQQEDDKIRTNFLQERGYKVIRFKNNNVNTDVKSVIRRIKEVILIIENTYEE